jgi:hypothetical protein
MGNDLRRSFAFGEVGYTRREEEAKEAKEAKEGEN